MLFLRRTPLATLLISLFLSGVAVAQNCNTRIYASTPTTRFQVAAPGTVVDTKHQLMWMRCPLGMRWKADTCVDVAANFVWLDVKYDIAEMNRQGGYAGHRDWRLPTLKELEGIVEHRCIDPAINSEIFPDTPPTGFWSSSEDARHAKGVWLIYFLHGKSYVGNAQQEWKVRLVRDAR